MVSVRRILGDYHIYHIRENMPVHNCAVMLSKNELDSLKMFGCTNENETGPHLSLTFITNEEIDKLQTMLNNTIFNNSQPLE